MYVSVCLSVCLCLLEAVDLSSTQRSNMSRVLPPPRPPPLSLKPSHSSVTPQLSHPSTVPQLSPASDNHHSTMLSADQPTLKHILLPSVVDHRALRPTVAAAVTQSGTADPRLSLAGHGVTAAPLVILQPQTTGLATLLTDNLSTEQTSVPRQLLVPAVILDDVNQRSLAAQQTSSQLTSLPSDLSIKHTTHNTRQHQMSVPDDLSTEKSSDQPDNLSMDMSSKLAFVVDKLSTREMAVLDSVCVDSKSKCSVSEKESRTEQTSVLDGLPMMQPLEPTDLSAETQKDVTLVDAVTLSTESSLKSLVTSGEGVSTVDETSATTDSATDDTVAGE